jgi:hypothetical protein
MRLATKTTTMLFAAAMVLGPSATWAETATVTGTLGDAMCGVKHMVKGDDAACTRACVKGGAKYALLVKDKAYELKADAKTKAALAKYANQRVTVSGEQTGDTIAVTAVRPAK